MRIVALTVAALLLAAAMLPGSSPCAHGPCGHDVVAHDHHTHAGCSHARFAAPASDGDSQLAHRCGAEDRPLLPVHSCGSCGAPGCGCGPDAPDPLEPPLTDGCASTAALATGEVCPAPSWPAPASPLCSPPPRVGVVVLRT